MATQKAKAAGLQTKGLKVIARRDSFRRCGRVFGGEAVVIPLSDLTEEQVEQLKAEPLLVCQEVDIEPPAAEEKG